MKKYTRCMLAGVLFLFVLLQSAPASAASVHTTRKNMIVGEQYRVTAAESSSKITWSSSRPKVAKVNSRTGTITALSKGTAVITGKAGKQKYVCKIQVRSEVDIIIFAGQSNMTGVGNVSLAPALTDGAGYAFNPVTNRKKFSVLKEPFGYGQDDKNFYNGDYASGSLVTAFVNAYYKKTQTPVIAIPAASVGTGSVSWKEFRYKGINSRTKAAVALAKKKKLTVRHIYLVWMQGENDAFAGMSKKMHTDNLKSIFQKVKKGCKAEKCMVISIPSYYNDEQIGTAYKRIQSAQNTLCKTNDDFIMISTVAPTLSSSYLQADGLHLTQEALNKVGKQAGTNAGRYANSH